MITKIIKILRITVLCGLIVLAVILVNKYYVPEVNAAHNSATPESFIFTATSLSLNTSEGPGAGVVVWEGSEEIDIAAADPLSDILTLSMRIPPGEYYGLGFYTESVIPKIKASVVVAGTRYYTKASHTNYETGPAELEEMDVVGDIGQFFSPPIELTGTEGIHVLLDISYLLTYFDGNFGTSGPFASDNFTQAGWSFAGSPTSAVVFGAIGHKEEYEYTIPGAGPGYDGTNRLVLIFDGDDNLIGLNCRQLFIDNKWGNILCGGTETGLITEEVFQQNSDGTYKIQLVMYPGAWGEGTISTRVFENFQRKTHTGNFTYTEPDNPPAITGTYDCVKVD